MLKKLQEWPYLQELPEQSAGFSLNIDIKQADGALDIFSYENRTARKRLRCYYSQDTRDYILRRIIGLNEYNDPNFISPDQEEFTAMLRGGLTSCLRDLACPPRQQVLAGKKIPDWDYKNLLPASCAGFELYITPDASVEIINGSFVIADYSDFTGGHQLAIYYNELRDEFYAEKKLAGIVETTGEFDAETLTELTAKLKSGLTGCLSELRRRIAGLAVIVV